MNALKKMFQSRKPSKNSTKQGASILAAMVGLMYTVAPASAFAAPWDGVAEAVLDILNGGFGRTCAAIAIAVVGLLSFRGQVPIQFAISVIVGIMFIFGGAFIVDYFSAAASA
ncbi:TrbC/VirB2 family protein [Metapseudomonas otitidis]|uniref:TrbC/VirB2 family protein n=1 Tax=Metapseudomonas otitidis TaxID=319939 RepID=UPI000D19CFEC|nr:TrbC/VirB2 family protein [Pseudomonas otitidis]